MFINHYKALHFILLHDFRPHSTESFTHRKMTMSLADRSTKLQKVKVLPISGRDPEYCRNAMIKVRIKTPFNTE